MVVFRLYKNILTTVNSRLMAFKPV